MERQDQDNRRGGNLFQEILSNKNFQSTSIQIHLFDQFLTWKCFVLPGVDDTDTFLYCNNELIVELLPTFGYPT